MGRNVDLQKEAADIVFERLVNALPDITRQENIYMKKKFAGFSINEKMNLLVKLKNSVDNGRATRSVLLKHFNVNGINSNIHREECELDTEVDDIDYDCDNDYGDIKSKRNKNSTDVVKRDGKTYRTISDGENTASVKTLQPDQISKKEYKTLESLDSLTGLSSVKTQVRGLIAHAEISRLRAAHGLKSNKHGLRMMFKGNPGTGKTTVARLLGRIFKEIGVLSSGHVVEIDRSSLVSKYQGEFEAHVKKYVDEATGGILFIDEIYALFDDSESKNDQANKGIPVLLKLIEDKREDFICIGAGYDKEVNEFLESNPGLKSRFPIHLTFEDYTIDELVKIASDMFSNEDYKMEEDFITKLKECLEEEKQQDDFGNARTVRNIAESSIRSQSLRLFNGNIELNKDNLMSIKSEDFQYVPLRIEKKNKDKDKDKMEEFAEKLMEKMTNKKEEKAE